jgi:glycosyltransferase involved in cell wall biosynthesis
MSAIFFISLFFVVIALLRFLISLLNFLSRPILPNGKATSNQLVSVLIPARNEEKNVGNLLSDLLLQNYINFEVLVYDDCSTDGTASVVSSYIDKDQRITLIPGQNLPQGWLGKNYACSQLAQRAKGQLFLFLDADVRLSPWFVGNALAYMQQKRLALLSMFPRQEMKSLGERLVVPNMNWILLSLLFLRLVRWSKRRSLAAANGQMMMFDAKIYIENQWHYKVKSSPVEDIGISRLVKRKKYRMATLLGTDDISCRMYESYSEAITGFTKNINSFFGGSVFVTLIFTLVVTIGPFIVLFNLPFLFTFLYFFCLISSRLLIAKISEQKPFLNVILWPLQHFAFLHLVFRSMVFIKTKRLIWKGREVAN